jgi:hypothetical protein
MTGVDFISACIQDDQAVAELVLCAAEALGRAP